MYKRFLRICSILLTVALLVNILPAGAFAVEDGAQDAVYWEDEEEYADIDDLLENPAPDFREARILGEIEESRTEFSKAFALEGGLRMAVVYPDAVHYREEDRWQEIDNTLRVTEEGSYANTAGIWEVRLPRLLTENAPVTITKDGYTLSFRMVGELRQTGDQAAVDPEETIPDVSVPNEDVPSEDIPDESIPEETALNEDIPGEDIPAEAVAAVSPQAAEAQLQPAAEAEADAGAEAQILEKLQSRLTYADVYEETSIVYDLDSNRLKESVILRRYNASLQGYRYLLDVGALIPQLDASGRIDFYDADREKIVMVMPAPYLLDDAGNFCAEVEVLLEAEEDGTYALTYLLPRDWLAEENRAWPVTLDPVVFAKSTTKNISDQGISEQAAFDYTSGAMSCGHSQQYGIERFFLKFNELPELTWKDVPVGASISLYKCANSANANVVEVHRVKGAWESGSLTWSNKPSFDPVVSDYNTVENAGRYSWEITDIVRGWYGETNTGMMFKAPDEAENSNSQSLSEFYSSDYADNSITSPILTIFYRDSVGIEPYYTYATMGAGSAGTAYIADYSGQLKVSKNVLSYASTVNPFTLSLVYNSDYFSVNGAADYRPPEALGLSMEVGSGFTLNVIQKVETEDISGVTYLKYTDGDGTAHYFRKDTEKDATGTWYYDEDGLGLKLRKTGSSDYEMTDDKDNKWTFTGGYLKTIADETGNQLLIKYGSGKITSIAQKNKGCAEMAVATFAYSGNKVTSVKDAAGTGYTLLYSGNKLTGIKRGSASIAQYDYDGYRLKKMTDPESNYTLQFTYSGGKVTGYQELAGTVGGACGSISYTNQSQTIYRDYGADRTANTSDDLLTYYSFDYAGRTVNACTTDSANNLLGASNAVYSGTGSTDRTNNRTLRTASIGVAARNLVGNSSFESGGGWAFSGQGGTGTNIVMSGDCARTGAKSLKGWISKSTTAAIGATASSVSLTAGETYTFSGYINTSEAVDFNGTGVFLSVRDPANVTRRSSKINYKTSGSVDDGWERVSVTFTATVSGVHKLIVWNDNVTGIFYADDLQLEAGEAPSTHNLLENGAFTNGVTGWSRGNASAVTTASGGLSGNALKVTGTPNGADRYASQTVTLNRSGTQTYVLSGWAKANAVPDNVKTASDPAQDLNKQFGLRAVLTYTDGAKEYHYAPFHPDLTGWQFTSLTIVPKAPDKTVSTVQVVCAYERNANTACFDDLSLTREAAQTMKYDESGNLVSVSTSGLKADADTYQGGNLIKTVTGGNGTYTYTYDDTYKHRLVSVTDSHVTQTLSYDGYGNVKGATLKGGNLTMQTSATYTNSGNLTETVTGASGETTSYEYIDNFNKMTGLPSSVTNAMGATVNNTYDDSGRVLSNSIDNSAKLEYSYKKGNLTAVNRTGAVAGTQQYNFTYDDFGNRRTTQVGSKTLAKYSYAKDNGNLTKQTYGNGAEVNFTYDRLDRIKTTAYSGGRTLTYTYNGDGQLAAMTDSATGETYSYTYDSLGRLVTSGQSSNGARLSYRYDDCGRIKSRSFSYPGLSTSAAETYTYDGQGLLESMTMVDWRTISLKYDALDRLEKREIAENGLVTQTYAYAPGSQSGTTSNRIATYESKYTGATSTATFANAVKYRYEYDAAGNITKQTDLLTTGDNWAYTYGKQGELITAQGHSGDGSNAKYVYDYDAAGNLTSKTVTVANGVTPIVTYTDTYTYGDTNWKDLLTAFNGNSITYDAIGNPTKYYDGSTMKWTEGRRLSSVTKDGKTTSFLYDANGQRLKKTSPDGSYSKYCIMDGRVVGEIIYKKTSSGVKWDHGVRYIYGDDGSVIGFGIWDANTQNEWERYYFVKNLQGDVMKVYREDGNALVASYEYDPFGNIIYSSGDMADQIPFRYRGYYYDTETGLYYLQSRYYDPTTCRFINADSLATTGQGFAGYNMFAYCNNSPVGYSDPSGHMLVADTLSLGNGRERRGLIDRALHAGNNLAVGMGIDTAAIGAFFLDMDDDGTGIYHADFDCWQQYFGYNDLYDFFFDVGTSCQSQNFQFTYNGQEYIIWVWKGDYINLGAGAEMGIYTGGGPHWQVDKSLAMPMQMELKYYGTTIASYSDCTWWITSFNPNYLNKDASSLTATFSIQFDSPGMYNAFRSTHPSGWTFGFMSGIRTASYSF